MDDFEKPPQIRAPWTEDQVAALSGFQHLGWVHEFTCGTDGCRAALVATPDGWTCPLGCGYRQTWAWAAMADRSSAFWRHPLEKYFRDLYPV